MTVPHEFSWVEELSDFATCRVDASKIDAFAKIAINTGQRQVVDRIAAAMLLGSDVLDLQPSYRRVLLRQLAILAARIGPLSNCTLGTLVHGWP